MIYFSKIPRSLAAKLTDYHNKIVDASIVGHSTRARSLRLEAAEAIMQAHLKIDSPLLEQVVLFQKNHLEALQRGKQEQAKEWLLASYAAYQILFYGPAISNAAQKAMEQRVSLAHTVEKDEISKLISQHTTNPQEQDCREQAAFHTENVVDYLLRASEAKHSKNDFLIKSWEEVAEGASQTALLWIKAAKSFQSCSLFGLTSLFHLEIVRHSENKNKRKLLRIASYISILLSQQQWKDPFAEKDFCQQQILKTTSTGNILLALYWRRVKKEIDFFLQHTQKLSPKAPTIDSSLWNSFIRDLQSTSPLKTFLYGIPNDDFPIPATSWIFSTDERLEAAANYRYWATRSQLLLKDKLSDWTSRLLTEERSSVSNAEERIYFWKENIHAYQSYSTKSHTPAWNEAARRARQIVLLWKKSIIKKREKNFNFLLASVWSLIARSAEKKIQYHLCSILMQTISFCLPKECIPDLECKEAWKKGKLVPRIEFTMFYSWIYQSWQRLQQAGVTSALSTKLLEPGVVMTLGNYLTTSLGLDAMMPKETFLVDVTADRPPHPGAQLHVVENRMQTQLLPHAVFIPHWPQRGLIPRDLNRGLRFENVAFFGEPKNLAPELHSKAWQQRLSQELGITFYLQGNQGWHDYSNVDAVIAIRSFSSSRYLNKPATKLYNAWHAGVPFIGGLDSAFAADGRPGTDYLVATSLEEVFSHLEQLKKDSHLRAKLVQEGFNSAKNFTSEVILEHWKKLIEDTIPKSVAAWQKKNSWSRRFFFLRQYFAYLLCRYWK